MTLERATVGAQPRLIDALPGMARTTCRSPAYRPALIERDGLTERLVATDATAVAITAPAGYGKTTTVLLWDRADDRPFVWAQLDSRDDDPVHLCQHLALALEHVGEIEPDAVRRLSGPGRSVELDLLPVLIRILETMPPTVLVLDDTHTLRSTTSLHCIEILLAGVPPGSALVLVGRSQPDLPMARRRLTGGLLEITASDLAMSTPEATLLFQGVGMDLSNEQTEALVEQTEGWPAGLHLAEMFLRSRGGDAATSVFTGRNRLVGDFLVEEVLSTTQDDVVEFLERSAVLDMMTAPLLDEVLDRHDSAQMLQSIERSGNLFLIPLDDTRDHFRYHHLFADLLRERLKVSDPGLALDLDQRASKVLETHGDIDGALRHALRAGDEQRAADLIMSQAAILTFQGRIARLALWLDLLGEGAMERSPSAAAAWAWGATSFGDGDLAARALGAAERFDPSTPLPDGSPSIAVAIAAARAVAGFDGVLGVLRDTETVRACGGPEDNPWWIFATVVQGTCYSMLGQLDLARQRFEESLAVSTGLPMYEAGTLAHLALLALYEDNLAEADRLSSRAVRIADLHNLDGVIYSLPVLSVGALVAARSRRFDDARALAARSRLSIERLGDLSPRSIVFGTMLLARTMLILGDRAAARSLVEAGQRARQRDPSALFLNKQLDEIQSALTSGAGSTLEVERLTETELRILAYLPTHLSLQEIASELNVSRNTVKTHTVGIYRKLDVQSRSEAVAYARHIGLLP